MMNSILLRSHIAYMRRAEKTRHCSWTFGRWDFYNELTGGLEEQREPEYGVQDAYWIAACGI